MYNEKSLKNQLTEVINNELNSLGRVFKKQYYFIKADKMVRLNMEKSTYNRHMTISSKSIIIEDMFNFVCIDAKNNNKYDISAYELPLLQLTTLANTLALALDTMTSVECVEKLDNDYSGAFGAERLLVEIAFDALKRDTLVWYYLDYELKILSGKTLEIVTHKDPENHDFSLETVLEIKNGICFIRKRNTLKTKALINMILDTRQYDNEE